MHNKSDGEATAAVPAPIALSADELRRVAAGTGVLLGGTVTPLSIYGGIRVPAVTAMATMVE